jgi:FAD/FMN-containing dehydrogenase
VVQLRAMGGAVARVPREATAFAHRDRPLVVTVGAVYEDADERSTHDRWARETTAEVSRGRDGVYVGFLASEGEERVREAYPGATWERLRRTKARYDPENLFRLNQNIPPG